ncbi:MAG: transcriptional repressor [Opitutaceae bacterium]|nr:transcriptional repressor [Opitutaceae bacterium]
MIAPTQSNSPFAGAASVIALASAKMRAAGGRVTKPRIAMLTALASRRGPSTIEQIHSDVGAECCDLVTIYRSMAAFEELGVVRRSFFHNGTALYELSLNQPASYHVVCKNTQRIDALEPELAAELRRAIDGVQRKLLARGYADISHMVEFFGVSPATAATN